MAKQPELTEQEIQALTKAKKMFGRTWKADLRTCWMNAHYPLFDFNIGCILQSLRNSSKFGPLGLIKVKI